MHYFEDKFAAIGRGIDRVIERARDRSPKRYRPRSGPTMRERWLQWRDGVRDNLRNQQAWRWRDWDPALKRRVLGLGSVLVLVAAAAVGIWLWRSANDTPTLQEMMEQASVRARMEMSQAAQTSPFKGWGSKN